MSDETPPELIEHVRKLMELEKAGERTTLRIGPFGAFLLIGVLQWSTRNPGLSGYQREVLRDLARQLEPLFKGTPVEESLRQGYHPEFDKGPDER